MGQSLLLGGVRQPGTNLVYFPADEYSIYVLDVAKCTCAAILYTEQAAGSLRGLPLIWNDARGPAQAGAGCLLLTQAAPSDGLLMKPYRLPFRQPNQTPAKPQIQIRGDTWTAPWHDTEKLALATSAGLLALYGMRLDGDRDPLLFPLLDSDFPLDESGAAVNAMSGGERGLVVHADAQNYWVLTRGKLQRLQATFTAQKGRASWHDGPSPPTLVRRCTLDKFTSERTAQSGSSL